MSLSPRSLISGAIATVTKPLTGDGAAERSAAAEKAARTRKANAAKRSASARKAAESRKANADARSAAAKRGARTRSQKRARIDAMVEATRRD